MGGRLKPGKCVIGGVVDDWVRDELDKHLKNTPFSTRSQLIGAILTFNAKGFMEQRERSKVENTSQEQQQISA